jgi:hypothetical protein
MTDIDLLTQFTEYKTEIARILDRTEHPGDQVPDADARAILEVVKKIGALGTRLRATAKAALPAAPEPPDPLQAGAKLHALALAEIERSGGKLGYPAAFSRICMNNWDMVKEWQQSVQAPRRRR